MLGDWFKRLSSLLSLGTSRQRPSRCLAALWVEELECRALLAAPPAGPFYVASAMDGKITDVGTLRWAIDQANKSVGQDRIVVNVPGGVITLNSALPTITDKVSIEGNDRIDGSKLMGENGLKFAGAKADGSELRGLTIQNFKDGAGILLEDVAYCVIGTNASGTKPHIFDNEVGIRVTGVRSKLNRIEGSRIDFNKLDGVQLEGNSSQTYVGVFGREKNVISGNKEVGVHIVNSNANVIVNNFIGPDETGAAALIIPDPVTKNPQDTGVKIEGKSTGNHIGTTVTIAATGLYEAANVISGNLGAQIDLTGEKVTETTVFGNFIGLDRFGSKIVDGSGAGVHVHGATGVYIGQQDMSNPPRLVRTYTGRNIIATKLNSAITALNVNKLVIDNNYIGTDVTGKLILGAGSGDNAAVDIGESTNLVIGRDMGKNRDKPANVIVATNGGIDAISISGTTPGGKVMGNFIGVNADGRAFGPNAIFDTGITLRQDGVQIGGPNLGMGNRAHSQKVGGKGPAG